MKLKNIFTILLLISATYAQGQTCRKDTTTKYSINNVGTKTPYYLIINEFNSNNSVTKKTEKNRVNSAWENYKEVSYTYNSASKQTMIIEKRWVNNTWENFSKSEFTFNANNLPLESNNYNWNNSNNTWMPGQSVVKTYDANGNETSVTYKNAYLTNWLNSTKSEMEYDGNNNKTVNTNLVWDNTNMVWVKQNQQAMTYTANKKVETIERRNWNAGSSAFFPQFKESYTYNSSNLETTMLNQNWNGSSWDNSTRIVKSYQNDKLTRLLNQVYYGPTLGFKSTSAETYIFNADDLLVEKLNTVFANDIEKNNLKETYTYNANKSKSRYESLTWNATTTTYKLNNSVNYGYNGSNKLILEESFSFSSTYNSMLPVEKQTYEFDANGLQFAYENSFNFSASQARYQTINREEYACSNMASVHSKSMSEKTASLYPNPASDKINIKIDNKTNVSIYNNMGFLVFNILAENELLEIDLSKLTTGMYMVQMKQESGISFQKLNVIK